MKSSPKASFRPEIEGLRGVAVISVLLNHANPSFAPNGYLGVDVFFVISGFLITRILLQTKRETISIFLLNFYVRRFKRLAPALIFFVITASIFGALTVPIIAPSLRTGIGALLGCANIQLYIAGVDYFTPAIETNAFLHLWSLGVEDQFYFLFPFFIWFLARSANVEEQKLAAPLFVISVASLIAFAICYNSNREAAYYLLPFRFWEIGAGCLAALQNTEKGWLGNLLRHFPQSVLLVGLIGLLLAPSTMPVLATIATVTLTAAIISSPNRATTSYKVLSIAPIAFIGRISYSLYLWHWAVFWYFAWYPNYSPTLILAAKFIFSLTAAVMSYFLVEQPFRFRSWASSPGREMSLACGAILACVTTLVVMHAASAYLLPDHLRYTWWKDRATGRYIERCMIEREFNPAVAQACLTIPKGPLGRVFVFGDSHARNYLPAVRSAFKNYAVAYLTMGYGCAYLPPEMAGKLDSVGCAAYVDTVDSFISKNLSTGDVLVFGQRLIDEPERISQRYVGFLAEVADRASASGVPVILLDGTYPPVNKPEMCLGAASETAGCFSERSIVQNAFAAFDSLAREAMLAHKNLFYVPLRDGLCEQLTCGQTLDGVQVWHDRGHITEAASLRLAPLLKTRLNTLGFFEAPRNRTR